MLICKINNILFVFKKSFEYHFKDVLFKCKYKIYCKIILNPLHTHTHTHKFNVSAEIAFYFFCYVLRIEFVISSPKDFTRIYTS